MEETLNREDSKEPRPCLSSIDDQKESHAESVSLSNLSELTNFPVDFLKKELLLDQQEDISLEDLRKRVLHYLDDTFDMLKK